MKRLGFSPSVVGRCAAGLLVGVGLLTNAGFAAGFGFDSLRALAQEHAAYEVVAQQVDRFVTLRQTNLNHTRAAEKQVAAIEAAVKAGRVTPDLLLDARRRLVDAEIAYAESTLNLASFLTKEQRKQLQQTVKQNAYVAARDQALKDWKTAYREFQANPNELQASQAEGQTREQFFFYRAMVDEERSR